MTWENSFRVRPDENNKVCDDKNYKVHELVYYCNRPDWCVHNTGKEKLNGNESRGELKTFVGDGNDGRGELFHGDIIFSF